MVLTSDTSNMYKCIYIILLTSVRYERNFHLKQVMKVERGMRATISSTSALDGGGWSMPRSGSFTPENDGIPNL